MATPENWSTVELFNYAVLMGLISPDEEFEDWKNNRTELYEMVQNEFDNV
jgi:hypothetical protein